MLGYFDLDKQTGSSEQGPGTLFRSLKKFGDHNERIVKPAYVGLF